MSAYMKFKLDTFNRRTSTKGFSLVELLVVIAIVGILIAVGYPSYSDFLNKSRRSDGALALMEATQAMERCKSTQFTYATCTLSGPLQNSPEGYYSVALNPAPTSSTFTIVATPKGIQVNDKECTSLAINHLGKPTSLPGTAGEDDNNCWN